MKVMTMADDAASTFHESRIAVSTTQTLAAVELVASMRSDVAKMTVKVAIAVFRLHLLCKQP